MSTYGYANGSQLMYGDPEGLIAGKIAGYVIPRLLPGIGLRLGATHAVRRVGPRVARDQIERLARKRVSARVLGYCRPSSKALRRALEAAGYARQPGTAAHHIVAGTAKKAAEARAALQRFGIGTNEATNGVFLQKSVHARIHTSAYYEAINRAVSQATTRAEAIEVLTAIRQAILSGGFP